MKKLIKSNWLYFFTFQLLAIQWVTGQAIDLTGAYDGAGQSIKVALQGNKLTMSLVGQPTY